MRKISAAVLLALLAFGDVSADPYAGYIYPAGIQAGTTNRFIVGGQKLRMLRGAHFECKGLHVVDIEPVPRFSPPAGMQRRHLKKWLDGIADGVREEPVKPDDPHITEWRSNRWWQALGTLGPLEISLVERYLFIPRNPLQDTPSISQMAIVTISADADAKPGMYSFSLWNDRGMSAPRPFAVTRQPHFPEPLFVPSHRKQPSPATVDASDRDVVLDGQIMPGQIDVFNIRFSGDRQYRIKVAAREFLPYIGDAVPGFFNPGIVVRDDDGHVVATADDRGRFRPDPLLFFRPKKSGVYRLEIHDVLFRGRADFVYMISVERHKHPSGASAVKPAVIRDAPQDGIIRHSGTVFAPGAVNRREFVINEAGPKMLEVKARRKGSSLDAVLTLRKALGDNDLAQWDDVTNTVFVGTIPQSEIDPVGMYDFRKPGRYIAEVSDRTRHGGKGYFWDLEIRPPKPDFEVYSTRSTLPLHRWRPLKVDFVVVRKDGFTGDVTLEFPKNVIAKNNVITSGVDRVTSVLTYVGWEPVSVCPVKIAACGKIGDKMIRRNVVPCDEYEQAFAWRHLVPSRSFMMRATPGRSRPKGKKPNNPKKRRSM